MGYNNSIAPMKEVEHSVLHAVSPGSKLVDAISEILGHGPAKLVALTLQLPEQSETSKSRPLCQPIQPISEWHRTVALLKKKDPGARHYPPIIAILLIFVNLTKRKTQLLCQLGVVQRLAFGVEMTGFRGDREARAWPEPSR